MWLGAVWPGAASVGRPCDWGQLRLGPVENWADHGRIQVLLTVRSGLPASRSGSSVGGGDGSRPDLTCHRLDMPSTGIDRLSSVERRRTRAPHLGQSFCRTLPASIVEAIRTSSGITCFRIGRPTYSLPCMRRWHDLSWGGKAPPRRGHARRRLTPRSHTRSGAGCRRQCRESSLVWM